MRSDNLEPVAYPGGPRCAHNIPMRLACSLCSLDADPLRAPGTDDEAHTAYDAAHTAYDAAERGLWLGAVLLLLVFALGLALGRLMPW